MEPGTPSTESGDSSEIPVNYDDISQITAAGHRSSIERKGILTEHHFPTNVINDTHPLTTTTTTSSHARSSTPARTAGSRLQRPRNRFAIDNFNTHGTGTWNTHSIDNRFDNFPINNLHNNRSTSSITSPSNTTSRKNQNQRRVEPQPQPQPLREPPRCFRGCPPPIAYWSSKENGSFILLSTSFYQSAANRMTSIYGVDLDRESIAKHKGGDGFIYRYDYRRDTWDKRRKYRVNKYRPNENGNDDGGGLMDDVDDRNNDEEEINDNLSDLHAAKRKMLSIGRKFKAWNHGHVICASKHIEGDGIWVFGNDSILGRFDLEFMSEHKMRDYYTQIKDEKNGDPMQLEFPVAVIVDEVMHIFGETLPSKGTPRRTMYIQFDIQKMTMKQHHLEEEEGLLIVADETGCVAIEEEEEEEQQLMVKEEDERESKKVDDGDKDDEKESVQRIPCFYRCKVIHIEHLREIWIFNGSMGNTTIWSYSLKEGTFRRVSDVLLPKKNTNNFSITLLSDRILMMGYVECKEILAMDVMGERKWIKKSVNSLHGMTADSAMVNALDHWIHFVNVLAPQHIMVWQYHLLPMKLLHSVYAPMAVAGYIRIVYINQLYAELGFTGDEKVIKDAIAICAEYCSSTIFE